MKRALAVAVRALLAASACRPGGLAEAGAPVTVERVLDRIQAAEDGIRDVRLKFVQVTRLKATGEEQATSGELSVLKSPERFRVTFASPVRQVANYDGACLVLYYPETGQAFCRKASPEDLSRLIGVNPASPAGGFRRGYGAALSGCDGEGCRIAFSRTGGGGQAWNVRVSATTWLMEEAWFENDEIRISMRCGGYRINRGLGPANFRLVLPRGTEVIEGIPQLSDPGGGR